MDLDLSLIILFALTSAAGLAACIIGCIWLCRWLSILIIFIRMVLISKILGLMIVPLMVKRRM